MKTLSLTAFSTVFPVNQQYKQQKLKLIQLITNTNESNAQIFGNRLSKKSNTKAPSHKYISKVDINLGNKEIKVEEPFFQQFQCQEVDPKLWGLGFRA